MFWTLFMYLTLPQDLFTTQMTQHKMLGFNVEKGIQWTWTPWTIPKHLCLNTGSKFLTVAHLFCLFYSCKWNLFFLISLIAPICSFGWLEGKAVMRNSVSREFTRWLHEPTWETSQPRATPCCRWTAWPHAAMNSTPWRLRQDPSANLLVNSFK